MIARHIPVQDRRAVAALEFALVAPIMIACLLAIIELTNLIRVQAKLNVMAGQLADMVAGQPSVYIGTGSNTVIAQSLADMCAGAALSLYPYYVGNVQASIGSTTVGTILVITSPFTDWTVDNACGTTSYHAGATVLFNYANTPRSLFTSTGAPYSSGGGGGTPVTGYSAISVQVRYIYANVLPRILGKTITLTASAVSRPRSNTTVTCVTNILNIIPIYCPTNP